MSIKENNPLYREGVEDGLTLAQKTHIPLEEVMKSFDKFFDKINSLKKIIIMFNDHHINNKDILGKEMIETKDKEINLAYLLDAMQKEMLKGEIHCGTTKKIKESASDGNRPSTGS